MAQYSDFGEMMEGFGGMISSRWTVFTNEMQIFYSLVKEYLSKNVFYIIMKLLLTLIIAPVFLALTIVHLVCFGIFCVVGWLPLVNLPAIVLCEISRLLLKLSLFLMMIPEFCFKESRDRLDERAMHNELAIRMAIAEIEGEQRRTKEKKLYDEGYYD